MVRAVGMVVIGKTEESVAHVDNESLVPEQSRAEFSNQFLAIRLHFCVRPIIGNTRFNNFLITDPPSEGNITIRYENIHKVTP